MSREPCFNCGEHGHWARDCLSLRGRAAGVKKTTIDKAAKQTFLTGGLQLTKPASSLLSVLSGVREHLAPPSAKVLADFEARLSGHSTAAAAGFAGLSDSGEPPAKRPRYSPPAATTTGKDVPRPAAAHTNARLSPAQEAGVAAFLDGRRNVFFTGSAGVGKSFLLKELCARLTARNISWTATASTGTAAVALHGTTLHSFAGIGLGREPVDFLVNKIRKDKTGQALDRWRTCEVLIIDEISMIEDELFSKLEEIARRVRGSERPFGGIRLVICGDFFQLPPVAERCERGDEQERAKFTFEGQGWRNCNFCVVVLTEPFRQSNLEFVRMLEVIRGGGEGVAEAAAAINRACVGRRFPDDGIEATTLFPHRNSADGENFRRLGMLPGEEVAFDARDTGQPYFVQLLDKACLAPRRLVLKMGAQVVLLKNLDVKRELCNGARGCVVGFTPPAEGGAAAAAAAAAGEPLTFPIVQFVGGAKEIITPETWDIKRPGSRVGDSVASRIQVPLMLAWALSVHKCQGMTLTRVDMNLEKVFEYGQAYVALSRVQSLEGLRLRSPVSPKVMCASPYVVEYYKHPF